MKSIKMYYATPLIDAIYNFFYYYNYIKKTFVQNVNQSNKLK